jgi:hypothetical protein
MRRSWAIADLRKALRLGRFLPGVTLKKELKARDATSPGEATFGTAAAA